MSDEKKLEALLQKHGAEIFDSALSEGHIADERLTAAPPPAWSSAELAHLSRCAECRDILGEHVRSLPRSNVIPFRSRVASILALAAALILGFIVIGRDGSWRGKGGAPGLEAELTVLATNAAGERRDVRAG